MPKTVYSLEIFEATGWKNTDFITLDVAKDNPYLQLVDGVLYNLATSTLVYYGLEKMDTEYSIREGIRFIGEKAFGRGSLPLKIVNLPTSIEIIKHGAFEDMENLTTITGGTGLIRIGWYAFAFCPKLKSITLPEGLRAMQVDCFRECKRLKTLRIPRSVRYMDDILYSVDKKKKIYTKLGGYADSYAVNALKRIGLKLKQ